MTDQRQEAERLVCARCGHMAGKHGDAHCRSCECHGFVPSKPRPESAEAAYQRGIREGMERAAVMEDRAYLHGYEQADREWVSCVSESGFINEQNIIARRKRLELVRKSRAAKPKEGQ